MSNLLLKQSAQSEKRPDHKRRQFFFIATTIRSTRFGSEDSRKTQKIIDSSEKKDKNCCQSIPALGTLKEYEVKNY